MLEEPVGDALGVEEVVARQGADQALVLERFEANDAAVWSSLRSRWLVLSSFKRRIKEEGVQRQKKEMLRKTRLAIRQTGHTGLAESLH